MNKISYSDLISSMENACNRESTPPLIDGRTSEDFIIEQELMLREYLQMAHVPLIQYHGVLECTAGKWKRKCSGTSTRRSRSTPPSSDRLHPIRRTLSLSSIDIQSEEAQYQQNHRGDNADQFDIHVLRSQLKRKMEVEKNLPCENCQCKSVVKEEVPSSHVQDTDPVQSTTTPVDGNLVASRRREEDRKIKKEEVVDDLDRPATPPAALSPSPPPSPIATDDVVLQPTEDQLESIEVDPSVEAATAPVQVNMLAGLSEHVDPHNNEISMENNQKTTERQSSSESPNLTATNSYGSSPDRPHSSHSGTPPGLVCHSLSEHDQRPTDGDMPMESSLVGTSTGSSRVSDGAVKMEERSMSHSALENGLSAMSLGAHSLGLCNPGVGVPESSQNPLIQNPSMPHIVMHSSVTSTAPSVQVHPGITAQLPPQDIPGTSQQHHSAQPLPRVFETFGVDPPNTRNGNVPGFLNALYRYNGPFNDEIMRRLSESYGVDWRCLFPDVPTQSVNVSQGRDSEQGTSVPVPGTQITQHPLVPPTPVNPPIQPPPVATRRPGRPPSISIQGGDPLTHRQPQPLPTPQAPIRTVSSAVPLIAQPPQPFGVVAQQMQLQANGIPQNWTGLPIAMPASFNPQTLFGGPIPSQPTALNQMRPPPSQFVNPVVQHHIARPPPQAVIHPGMIRSQSAQPIMHDNVIRPAPVQPVIHPGMIRSQSGQPILPHQVIRPAPQHPVQHVARPGMIRAQSVVPHQVMRAPAPQLFHPSMLLPQPARPQSVQHVIINNVIRPVPSASVHPPQPTPSQGQLQMDGRFPSREQLNYILERFEKMGLPRSRMLKERNDSQLYPTRKYQRANPNVPKEYVARKRKAPAGLEGCRPDKGGRHNFPPPPPPPAIC